MPRSSEGGIGVTVWWRYSSLSQRMISPPLHQLRQGYKTYAPSIDIRYAIRVWHCLLVAESNTSLAEKVPDQLLHDICMCIRA